MTISQIRPAILRRAVVAFTVAALVVIYAPLWIWAGVRDHFGEDVATAWKGQ